ncbi:MAG: tetratricopeptide repeat protein, partial [Armatimonadetes bacterium]|nr:tetratricopeptide repeat protein [Armatimonadota bacterium]
MSGNQKKVDKRAGESHYDRGVRLEEEGRVLDAIAEYRKAIEQSHDLPDLLDIYIRLGDLLESSEQPDEAERIYRDAVQRFPDDPNLRNEFGHMLDERGQPGPALDQYQAAVRLNPDFAPYH